MGTSNNQINKLFTTTQDLRKMLDLMENYGYWRYNDENPDHAECINSINESMRELVDALEEREFFPLADNEE